MGADEGRAGFEALQGMLQVAMSDGGGSDHERAIGHGFGNGGELFSVGENLGGANRGARAFVGDVVRIHYTQVKKSEVAHGAGGGADVEGIAGVD